MGLWEPVDRSKEHRPDAREAGRRDRRVSGGWRDRSQFYESAIYSAMLFIAGSVASWLFFCVLVGVLAGSWSRNGLLYTGISFIASPIVGLVLLLALGKESQPQGNQLHLQCPKCDTLMNPSVDYCPGCGVEVVGAKDQSGA